PPPRFGRPSPGAGVRRGARASNVARGRAAGAAPSAGAAAGAAPSVAWAPSAAGAPAFSSPGVNPGCSRVLADRRTILRVRAAAGAWGSVGLSEVSSSFVIAELSRGGERRPSRDEGSRPLGRAGGGGDITSPEQRSFRGRR